jgi:serine-type D-Ala-D-Ala carboxypeptidase/endopeptidase
MKKPIMPLLFAATLLIAGTMLAGLMSAAGLSTARRAAAGASASRQTEAAAAKESEAMPTDAEIRQMLVERIDTMHRGVGIVVGIIGPEGRRIIAYGNTDKGGEPVNGETIFEIGSVSKVFTSLLLTDMVQRGEVTLDDPVAKYLPATVKVPERNGKQITLVDLATHTSGLPRMPTNFAPKDMSNPYIDYSDEQLYEFLSGYQLTRDIGSRFEYSNLGMGLLGFALARRAGTDYETLVRTRICDPLGMSNTRIMLTPEMKARYAAGHDAELKSAASWFNSPATVGAGALRSDANDMLTFLGANLGYVKTPLAPAMGAMLVVRRPTIVPNMESALGWQVTTTHGKEIVWKNGGTAGYRAFIGFDPKSRVGVVALSNAGTPEGVDDIGLHLLDAQVPVMRPHKEVKIDPKIFDGYVGAYQLRPGFILRVSRDGDHFITQATGQGQVEIFPESEKEFFAKVVDAQITFVTDEKGRATALILHQNGAEIRAERVEGAAAAAAPPEHKQVAVDPKILENYVGTYQLAPSFAITITRDGEHLFEQATAQPKFEIFPESEKGFFLKVVDAQITFVTDDKGRATAMILHQNGMDHRGERVDAAGEGATGAGAVAGERKQVSVDPKIYDGYVGTYPLTPNFAITITRDGEHLYEQATGQDKFEIFPQSEKDFLLKVVDAQITFVTDDKGRATELILHQNGMDQHAKRSE